MHLPAASLAFELNQASLSQQQAHTRDRIVGGGMAPGYLHALVPWKGGGVCYRSKRAIFKANRDDGNKLDNP